MASEISYIFLFGLLTLINGKPINNEEINSNDIQRLLEELSDQNGKYDISLSHHEDGPKSHHEDTARISKYRDAPRDLLQEKRVSINPSVSIYRNKPSVVSRSDSDNILLQQLLALQDDKCDSAKCRTLKWKSESQSNNEYDTVDEVLEFLNDLDKNFEADGAYDSEYRCVGNRCGRERSDRDDTQSRFANYVRNKDRYNLRCKGNSCARNRDDNDDDNRYDRDNLRCSGDKCGRNRVDDDRNELRCAGDRCGVNRDDARDDRNRDDARDDRNRDDARDDRNDLRCSGNRCSINRDDRDDLPCGSDRCGVNRDDARDDRNDLRCSGDRCNINRDDRDDLRCSGDRCGVNRDDTRDDRNDLRCSGDRCSINRDDRDDLRCANDKCGVNKDDARDDRNDLRCSGDKCNINRDDRDDLRCSGDRCGVNRDDARDDRNDLRCSGDRCSRNRDDRIELNCVGDRCNINRDDSIDLTCTGNRCSSNRADDDRDDRDNLRCRGRNCARSRYDDNNYNIKYESVRRPKQFKISEDLDAVILDMADLDRLLSNLNVRKNKLRGAKLLENVNLDNLLGYSSANDKKANIEAVVFDLEKKNDRDALSKQIKRLLSQSNLSLK